MDVLKVKLVTEYLTTQDVSTTHRARKHDEWLRLYDSLEPRCGTTCAVRRSEDRGEAAAAGTVGGGPQCSLDARRSPRWQPDGEAWLESSRRAA